LYCISNNVIEIISKFIKRIRYVDNHIHMLIHDYIKRIDIGHPQLQIYYKKTMVHMI
ncbi:hypothetical protein H8356DRAFT_930887, partial [Neocallimastix lanati (nom. inval.)]